MTNRLEDASTVACMHEHTDRQTTQKHNAYIGWAEEQIKQTVQ